MAFFGLIGNDKQLAQQYSGRESASEKASRKRRASHHRTGAKAADRQGQAWADSERARQDHGGWRRNR